MNTFATLESSYSELANVSLPLRLVRRGCCVHTWFCTEVELLQTRETEKLQLQHQLLQVCFHEVILPHVIGLQQFVIVGPHGCLQDIEIGRQGDPLELEAIQCGLCHELANNTSTVPGPRKCIAGSRFVEVLLGDKGPGSNDKILLRYEKFGDLCWWKRSSYERITIRPSPRTLAGVLGFCRHRSEPFDHRVSEVEDDVLDLLW